MRWPKFVYQIEQMQNSTSKLGFFEQKQPVMLLNYKWRTFKNSQSSHDNATNFFMDNWQKTQSGEKEKSEILIVTDV